MKDNTAPEPIHFCFVGSLHLPQRGGAAPKAERHDIWVRLRLRIGKNPCRESGEKGNSFRRKNGKRANIRHLHFDFRTAERIGHSIKMLPHRYHCTPSAPLVSICQAP